jgi:phosphate acyltransferase
MTRGVTISLDAMGGDHGPEVVIPGAALALERHPGTRFILFGDQVKLEALVNGFPALKQASEIRHTDVSVSMQDKPSQALRRGRRVSSMWQSIEAVKQGQADVAVSAGNTGALMAMATFCLKPMAGIERPAIACLWPTVRGESIVLDVGASIGGDAKHLVNLAVMGAALARIVFDVEKPSVGLLNVGAEEIKGNDEVKEAGKILRETPLPGLSYHGNVEGDDLGQGTSDVVVVEGFTGNIALKTAEGTAKQIGTYLRGALSSSWMSKLGYLFAARAFRALREKMDPRRVNGGVFLGLEGVVIKSHGGTDTIGFAAAVDLAYDMAQYDLLASIRTSLHQIHGAIGAQTAQAASGSNEPETGSSQQ